jgi:hypothetical protein
MSTRRGSPGTREHLNVAGSFVVHHAHDRVASTTAN